MENHTFISATFEYKDKLVEKNVDFWEKMYDDPIRLLLIGPMEIIFFMIYVPAFIGIFDYIRFQPVKYGKPNIFLNTIGGPCYFGRVLVPQRLINQSLYHEILLLQKFNDLSRKVLKHFIFSFYPHGGDSAQC